MAESLSKPLVPEGPSRPTDQKVLESFRSFAVGFERDLLKVGARETAILLGAARQAAEETLAAAERDAQPETRRPAQVSRGGPWS